MLRITINKEVTDVSLKTVVLPQYWDKHKKRIVKTAPEAQAINTYLDDVYTTVHYYYKQALLSSKHITSNMLKQRFLLIGNTPPTLLELFMKQKEDACRLFLANKISVSHYNKHGIFTSCLSRLLARKAELMTCLWTSLTDKQYMILKFSLKQITTCLLILLPRCWSLYVKVYFGHINAD